MMDGMNVVLAVSIVIVTALVFFWLGRRYLPATERSQTSPLRLGPGGRAVVVLEVQRGDPAHPAVQRLVHDSAARVFASMPDAEEVEVRTASGALLGRSRRTVHLPHDVAVSRDLVEPHRHRTHQPGVAEHVREQREVLGGSAPHAAASLPPLEPVPLVRRFDLPTGVAPSSPDDPLELLRAILQAGGIDARVEGEALIAGDVAVIAVRPAPGAVVDHEHLNHAYVLFQRSGAPRGLVACFGLLDPTDVRRREALAPNVRHIGPDGVQRMADAVAVEADPLRFAMGPALAISSKRGLGA
jgi:hypothetical protein